MSDQTMLSTPVDELQNIGINNTTGQIHYQLTPDELTEATLKRGEGQLSDTSALIVTTGEFTGRSPKDKFIVKDHTTENIINWNEFNIPIEPAFFERLYEKMMRHFEGMEIWVRDCYVCSHPQYRVNVRVINENPWCNLFAYNMFLRPDDEYLDHFIPDWHIIHAPGFRADPSTDGTRQHNFTIVNFTRKVILIGGSAYTGEIKKGVFTVLNYLLPHEKDVLSMHCSANVGDDGDTAIFFGLSGTGKTTLSADPKRQLIGDDEHGWTTNSIFNFEGGCYAKAYNLTEEKEPDIYNAVREGAIVENVVLKAGNKIDFSDKTITENTRVSYPLHYIGNALDPSIGSVPENIFFLTCDASGVLPPISKLSTGQAMYQFVSGYTARVAGTETDVVEPKSTFSACFGAPFLPLHPGNYAELLGRKIRESNVNVWLINTGWTGGPYGTGNRINLKYTRAMITAALERKLEKVAYEIHPVFGMMMPAKCPGVPSEILNPRNAWMNKENYDAAANKLALEFIKNFEKYASGASQETLEAAPIVYT